LAGVNGVSVVMATVALANRISWLLWKAGAFVTPRPTRHPQAECHPGTREIPALPVLFLVHEAFATREQFAPRTLRAKALT
jgi:hypothetical protein